MKTTNSSSTKIFIFLAIILGIVILSFTIFKLLSDIKNSPSSQPEMAQENIKVLLYIKEGCRYCNMAKALLTKNQIVYEVIDLALDPNLQKKLVDKTGQVTVPYIFINGKFIGGYSNLLDLQKENKL